MNRRNTPAFRCSPRRPLGAYRLLFAVAAGGWSLPAPADVLCRDATVSEDPFNGERELTLTRKSAPFEITADEAGPTLYYWVRVAGATGATLSPGFPVLFRLADGTQVTLRADTRAIPSNIAFVSQYGAAGTVARWKVSLPLSPEAIHAFAQSPITDVRFTIDKEVTYSPEGAKWTHWLQRDMACLANYLAGEPID